MPSKFQAPSTAATVRFSSTLSDGKISRSCATQPMPPAARRCGGMREMLAPRQPMVPLRSCVSPMMVSSSVDLPTPLRPSSARLPCSGSSSHISCRTTASPYPAVTWSSLSSASAMLARPQVHFAHLWIGGNLRRRSFGEYGTADKRDDMAGEAEHDMHVMLDEQQRKVV